MHSDGESCSHLLAASDAIAAVTTERFELEHSSANAQRPAPGLSKGKCPDMNLLRA